VSSSAEAYARQHGRAAGHDARLGDRYCAPCGWLFWRVDGPDGAAEHRRQEHPEQARFERGSIEPPPAPKYPIVPNAAIAGEFSELRDRPLVFEATR
jgi:hypothetical protein